MRRAELIATTGDDEEAEAGRALGCEMANDIHRLREIAEMWLEAQPKKR